MALQGINWPTMSNVVGEIQSAIKLTIETGGGVAQQ